MDPADALKYLAETYVVPLEDLHKLFKDLSWTETTDGSACYWTPPNRGQRPFRLRLDGDVASPAEVFRAEEAIKWWVKRSQV